MEGYSLASKQTDSILETDWAEVFPDYSPLLKKLLLHRGITEKESAEKFLNPDYENHLHDPFLLPDVEKAAGRIIEAIKNKEKILIYSDYDADGIPGAVILHDFFKLARFDNFQNYIPDRHLEGYGFHLDAVEKFAEEKVNLIITIDCGSNDVEQIKKTRELGIDVIVTDHHEVKEPLPPACAIVNPKRSDSKYPFPSICGAAVVFKLIQVVSEKENFGLKKGKEKWLLDMVGIATLSDMVPLIDENRVLAHFGLKVLRRSPRLGLVQLLKKLRIDQGNLSEDDISFMITPRINAASRIGNPRDAFRLLATKDEGEAEEVSTHLNKINDERKGLVAGIVKEARRKIENNTENFESVIVTGNPKWRPSLLGLVAGNLADEFGKPVFLWGRDGENIIKGSCRSDGKANILEIMEGARECFMEFGGHKMAGGFSVDHEQIHVLPEKISDSCKALNITENDLEKKIIEERLSPSDIHWQTQGLIESLSPFGVSNPKPLFLIENLEVESLRQFGKQKKHLELSFNNPSLESVKAIYFFADKKELPFLKPGAKVNLIFSLEKYSFGWRKNLRLRVEDIFNCEE
jgi:single-stranded-DNA-specific exonuclease